MTGRLLNGARWLKWSTPHGCAQWGERLHGRLVVVTKEDPLGGQERLSDSSETAEANACRRRRVTSWQWYGCTWCSSIDRGEGAWARFSRTDGIGVVGGAAARRENERERVLEVSGAQGRRCERRMEASSIGRVSRMVLRGRGGW
jgi:hypothetical protein